MALATAEELTQLHRLAQLRLGAQVVQQMMLLFTVLDPENLDGTFADWVDVVQPMVDTNRARSAELAATYMTTIRSLAVGIGDRHPPVLPGPINLSKLTTSLLVTGPISIRSNLARKVPLDKALDIANGYSAGTAMRHVLNAGRETITATVKADPRAVGWQRVVSGGACDFCSMLGDRGVVYSEETADFEAHDHCTCSAEPVYR